jgi:CheY-like chemotaxis protein
MPVVWYVDDDEEMIRAVSLMLDLLGYQTRPFFSARAAAQALLGGEKPALMILDINMPEVSGVDLLEFIRRRHEWGEVPVIMLSSEASDVQVDQAVALGADAYVFKPVTIDELEAAIERAKKARRTL